MFFNCSLFFFFFSFTWRKVLFNFLSYAKDKKKNDLYIIREKHRLSRDFSNNLPNEAVLSASFSDEPKGKNLN